MGKTIESWESEPADINAASLMEFPVFSVITHTLKNREVGQE